MITNIILLVLIIIVFYLILKSVKDRFQNVLCSHEYSGNDKDECIKDCIDTKKNDPACSDEVCRVNCIKKSICNNKEYETCDFNKCNWTVDENMCEVPKTTYYTNDEDNISFRKNLKVVNISEEENSSVSKPTKFKTNLTMMRLNGINSFVHIPDFYSKNTMLSFFFDFKDMPTLTSIPLISTVYWNVNLERKKTENYFSLIIKSSKNGNIAFSDAYYPLEIQAGFLYSFGLIINRETNTANILVYNLMNEENDINNKGLKINNFIYSETPSILLGTNIKRTKYLQGRLGEIKITREISDISILKRNSFIFSEEDIMASLKGEVIKKESIIEETPPSKINFVGKKINSTFKLYWSPPEIGYKSIMYYLIIIKDTTNNKNYTLIQKNNNCLECSYKLNNLELKTNYKIGITSINNIGICETIDYIDVNLDSSTNVPQGNGLGQDVELANDEITNKVYCNPNGSYSIGKNCDEMATEDIKSNLSSTEYRIILNKLNNQRMIDAAVDFKILL